LGFDYLRLFLLYLNCDRKNVGKASINKDIKLI